MCVMNCKFIFSCFLSPFFISLHMCLILFFRFFVYTYFSLLFPSVFCWFSSVCFSVCLLFVFSQPFLTYFFCFSVCLLFAFSLPFLLHFVCFSVCLLFVFSLPFLTYFFCFSVSLLFVFSLSFLLCFVCFSVCYRFDENWDQRGQDPPNTMDQLCSTHRCQRNSQLKI
jgi:hypothetical protein